jgi:hypothetical protein
VNGQLELETSRPAATRTPATAGREELSFPTDKATASFFAANWRRRGFDVELAKRGRLWCVVERSQ